MPAEMLLPALDPMPVPGPPWVFHALWLVTFAVHVVGVNVVLGASILGTLASFDRDQAFGRPVARLFAEINTLNLFGHDAAGIGIAQFGRRRGAGLVIVGCWWFPRGRFCFGGLLLGDHGGQLGRGVTDNVIGGQGELHRLPVDHVEDDGAGGDEVVTAQACLGAALALPAGVEDHHG